MSRWAPDARQRLEHAALELFESHGFAATTVPQITTRAGLTTRTFFRHFADKREVFFAGDEIPELAGRMVGEAPAHLDSMTIVRQGLRTVADTRFEGRRDEVARIRAIIRSDDGLQERDLRKRAALAETIRIGLIGRGEDRMRAALTADLTVGVLHVALESWLDDDSGAPMRDWVDRAFDSLRILAG